MTGPSRILTLDDRESGLTFAVWFDRWDMDRAQFGYRVSASETILAERTDLRLGAMQEPCEAIALGSLFSFLSAYAEAIAYERTGAESDNGDLFPESLREAADMVGADGFSMLAESVVIDRD